MKPQQQCIYLFIILTGFNSNVIAQMIRVTPGNFSNNGWTTEQVIQNPQSVITPNTPFIEIQCEPNNPPPLDRGSVYFSLPTTANPTLRRIRLRSINYDDIPLKKISNYIHPNNVFMYSTYIMHNINESCIELALQIDNDQDGKVDFNLGFSPTIQHTFNNPTDNVPDFDKVVTQGWQEWNASQGWWGIGVNAIPIPAELTQPFTLEYYNSIYPDARIINATAGDHAGGGIRFTIGGGPDFNDFEGYLDGFKISKPRNNGNYTTYDFKGTRCGN